MRVCPICEQAYSDETDICPVDRSPLPPAPAPLDVEQLWSFTQRYRIINRLGEGGMGSVFLAEQAAVGNRPVALKVLLRKLLDDPEFLERFRNEAASTGRIRHSNVVTIYESGLADDGTPYIAMEYLEGVTLRQTLQARGALPLDECTEILQQTARGLHAAHKLGIIHRDLKPDNIFLVRSEEGERLVKVLDFGIAKLVDSSHKTLTGVVLGTPAYMSAEHAAGMRGDELDARSDIYSLGVVVYEMLAGQVPFRSDTPLGYVRKHMLEPPPAFSSVRADLRLPPGLEKVVMKALEKDRGKRYSSVIEFSREFAAATVVPAPVPAPRKTDSALPPSPPGPVRRTPLPTPPAVAETATPAEVPRRPISEPTPVLPTPAAPSQPQARPQTPPFVMRPPIVVTPAKAVAWHRLRLPPRAALLIVGGVVLVGALSTIWYRATREVEDMLYVPRGRFVMGCDADVDPTGSPRHAVTVVPFYLDRTPVTNARYLRFVRATGYPAPPTWPGGRYPAGQENWPVTGVTWHDAQAYAKWKGKRLPTEAEWEFAARGIDERIYPWGSSFNANLTNSRERGLGHPEPVGSHPAAVSPFGVLDMSGNVWHWCEDAYKPYPGSPIKVEVPADAKVIRGGSFASDKNHVTVVTRNMDLATNRSDKIGFRCARSP